MIMKLTAVKRASLKKSDSKRIRRSGDIPAVLYSPKHPVEPIVVKGVEFYALIRNIQPGKLSTKTLILSLGHKERHVIIKDIQYQPTTYQVSHLDFEELVDDIPIIVRVPVTCTGVAECSGVKMGGFLRQIMRHVLVECLPANIPIEFTVDVKNLGIRQSRRLGDIELPKEVKPLTSRDEVIVVVAKR
jgi:large subunit ribosomal protein L25